MNSRRFIKDKWVIDCAPLRWWYGALTRKHFQMVMKGNFSSLHLLNKKIEVAVGWHENSPIGPLCLARK
jgi:hypothetical protein